MPSMEVEGIFLRFGSLRESENQIIMPIVLKKNTDFELNESGTKFVFFFFYIDTIIQNGLKSKDSAHDSRKSLPYYSRRAVEGGSMFFVPDSSEFMADNFDSLNDFLLEREQNAKWLTDEDGVKIEDVRFKAILDEPICVSTNVAKLKNTVVPKFYASEEAYADSMNSPQMGYQGSTQMMFVKGELWPVGNSAIRSILERSGIRGDGWEKLKEFSPQYLSEVLNRFMEASKGSACILIQDEKIRAVNSGRYAICPATYVVEETERWIKTERPQAQLKIGYVNHDYAMWQIDLTAYTNEVLGQFSALVNDGLKPAVQIYLSHTGSSSVSIRPCLMCGKVVFPLMESIDCPHIAKGPATDRMNQMKASVHRSFSMIFNSFAKATNDIEDLDAVNIKNAYGALLRVMKAINFPKVQGMEAAEQFQQIHPDVATAYDCFLAIVDAYALVARDYAKDQKKLFSVADCVGRASKMKWVDYDVPGDFSW